MKELGDPSFVFVVDDDSSFRRSTELLIRAAGLDAQGFGSAEEFLRSHRPDVPSCLILDVRLPHLSGLDLQRQLFKTDEQIPIIFISARATDQERTEAIAGGAVDFLCKPFREDALFNALQVALTQRNSG